MFEKHALLVGSLIIGTGIISYQKYGAKGILFTILAVFVIAQIVKSNIKDRMDNEQIR